jgi:hypothetical protein
MMVLAHTIATTPLIHFRKHPVIHKNVILRLGEALHQNLLASIEELNSAASRSDALRGEVISESISIPVGQLVISIARRKTKNQLILSTATRSFP